MNITEEIFDLFYYRVSK